MATLHVRNVPDELYERLRARPSERRARSAAETIVLLEAMLASVSLPHGAGGAAAAAQSRSSTSARARARSSCDAQEEARELGHDAIGTEHLLLALLGAARRRRVVSCALGRAVD